MAVRRRRRRASDSGNLAARSWSSRPCSLGNDGLTSTYHVNGNVLKRWQIHRWQTFCSGQLLTIYAPGLQFVFRLANLSIRFGEPRPCIGSALGSFARLSRSFRNSHSEIASLEHYLYRMVDVLGYLFAALGALEHLRRDNGPESVAKAVTRWLDQACLKNLLIAIRAAWLKSRRPVTLPAVKCSRIAGSH